MKVRSKLTVYFEEPFWVGVFERNYESYIETCKVVFASEPKDYEVYSLISEGYNSLEFSRPFISKQEEARKINPKRLQRKIRQETEDKGIGTKAQQAIQQERELLKLERVQLSRKQREELKEQKFLKRQMKKKEKKKGH